jgi:hypothetical protein
VLQRPVSRRSLLAAGALASVVAIVSGPVSALSALNRFLAGRDRHLVRSTYLPLMGRAFHVLQKGGSTTPMTLVAVRDLPGRTSPETAFALWFKGPVARFEQHPSLAVEQAQMGNFQLALMPVGRATDTQGFEAIINRLSR